MTHPKCYFYRETKKENKGPKYESPDFNRLHLGEKHKKCHKFVPTMRETENYILPSSGKSELDPCQLDSNFDPLTVLQTPSHALLGTP